MSRTDLDWGDIDRLTGHLAAHLPGQLRSARDGTADFDRIVGVARGGLIPAVLIASLLEVKCLESVQVRLYEGNRKLAGPELVGTRPGPAGPSGDPRRTLIVDEMLDSGTTLRFLRNVYPQACFAVLLGRHAAQRGVVQGALMALPAGPAGESAPSVWVAEGIEGDDWILFPWSPPEDRAAAL